VTIGRSGTSVDADALAAWAEAPPALSPPALRWVAVAITGLTIAAAAYVWTGGHEVALYFAIALQVAFALPYGRKVERMLHAADGPARDLAALLQAVELLERGTFAAPRLTLEPPSRLPRSSRQVTPPRPARYGPRAMARHWPWPISCPRWRP